MKAKHFILITFFLFIFNNKSLAQQHITDSNEITIYHKALEFFNNKNYQEALALLMPAAKRGFAKAQNLLAICYAYECGVDFDGEEALTWYEKAANQGLDDAQYNLGIIYAYGNIGYHYWGDKNIEKAIQLFKLSAEQGNEAAINKIVEIKSYESITKEYNIVRSGAVDLGLNVKWASCNLGAKTPEEYGNCYAWGETEPKEEYTWNTYKFFTMWSWNNCTITKYDFSKDGKTILDMEDDAAHVHLGQKWRIPTVEEFNELKEKCKLEFVEYYWTSGYVFTGPNGNSIFLECENIFLSPDVCARYATNSISKEEPQYANTVSLDPMDGMFPMLVERNEAFVIRPVRD